MRLDAPAAPWREVQVIAAGTTCRVALRTDRGWFVAGTDIECHDSATGDVLELATRDLFPAVAGAEVLIRVAVAGYQWSAVDHEGARDTCDGYVVACGGGASGVPSCTPAIDQRWGYDGPCTDAGLWDHERTVTFRDGALTVTSKRGDNRSWVPTGTFQLVFP